MVVEKGFLKENARAGFEASGFWPLNRNKISNEKLLIGTVFYVNALDENKVESILQEPVILKENLTPGSSKSRTPKSKKATIEENLKTIKKMFQDSKNAAAENLCVSVLNVMIKTYARTPKPAVNFRMESRFRMNHCLTGEEVRTQIVNKQLAADNEKRRIEQNKLDRAEKKLLKERAASEKLLKKKLNFKHFSNLTLLGLNVNILNEN